MLERLKNSFPKELSDDIMHVVGIICKNDFIDETKHLLTDDYSEFLINDDAVRIFYRFYQPEINIDENDYFNDTQKIILYCIYTRSYDGFVRHKYIKKILSLNIIPIWALVYIIKICDEYIIEILDDIYNELDCFDKKEISNIMISNFNILTKGRSRMISYWNCYYRNRFPKLENYVGYKIYNHLIGKIS